MSKIRVGELVTVNNPGHLLHGRSGQVTRISFSPNPDYNYICVQLGRWSTSFYPCHLRRSAIDRLAGLS